MSRSGRTAWPIPSSARTKAIRGAVALWEDVIGLIRRANQPRLRVRVEQVAPALPQPGLVPGNRSQMPGP